MSASELTVRPAASPEDEAIASLVNDAYGRTQTPSGWTSEDDILAGPRIEAGGVERLRQREGSEVLVAEAGGELAGCLHLQVLEEGACELGLLSVRPDLQDDGLGRRLLEAGEEHARTELGAERIVLKVISRREELIGWYERRGYEPTGESKRFEPEAPQRSLVGELSFDVLERELD